MSTDKTTTSSDGEGRNSGNAKIVKIGEESFLVGKLPHDISEDTPVGRIVFEDPPSDVPGAAGEFCCDSLCCDSLCGTDVFD